MLDAALNYLHQGYSIIPIKPDKTPYLTSWAKFQKFAPTEKTVTNWFKAFPDANIAVITGKVSGVVVVDVDDNQLLEQFLQLGPTEYIVQTSRGYHLYYTYPSQGKVTNQVKVDGKAVDVRGNGGYVIAPPSIHSSGVQYQFFANGAFGDCPDWLLQPTTNEQVPTVEKWITDVLRGIEEGDRNNQGIRLAGYYYSKHIPLDITLGLLENWNLNNQPQMDQQQLINIATGVYNTARRKEIPVIKVTPPKTAKVTEFSGVLDIKPSTNGYIVDTWAGNTEEKAHKLEFVGLDEYNKQFGGDDQQWLIDQWLPINSITMMVAPPESFKTWVGLDILLSIAGNYLFLDEYTVSPGPVLMLQLEDDHSKTINRIDLIHYHKHYEDKPRLERLEDRLVVRTLPKLPFAVHPHRALNLLNMATLRGLEDAIREIRPKLVYIDPLYAAGSTQDYLASTAQHFGVLKLLRDYYHTSFLIAHHTKKVADKTERKQDDRELSWGSQFVNAAIEGGYQIRQVPNTPNQITLVRHSKGAARPEKLLLDFDINTKEKPYHYKVNVTVDTPTEGKTVKSDTQIQRIREVLTQQSNQTVKELSQVLNLSEATIRRYLKDLIAAGEVIENKRKYALTTGARII